MVKKSNNTKRPNGSGSICFETATQKWRGAIVDPNGKRIVKRFKDKSEAEQWLVEIRYEIYKDLYVPPSDITLGEWVVEYLATYCAGTVRPKTLLTYQHSAKFLEPLADIKLQSLSAHSVQKFYKTLPNLADETKHKIHAFLKRAITKAHVLGMLQKNCMIAVEAPKIKKTEIEIYTVDEIKTIAETIQNSKYYSKYYPLYLLAISTGMRLGEILGLKTSCIGNGFVYVNNNIVEINGKIFDSPPKTNSSIRRITIPYEVEKTLRSINTKNKVVYMDGYVFHTKNGTAFNHQNIRRVWKAVQAEAGIKYRHFHCLRHTHATQLLAAGVPLLEVSKRLGHAKPSYTLELYGHAIPGYDTQIPDKVSQIFL